MNEYNNKLTEIGAKVNQDKIDKSPSGVRKHCLETMPGLHSAGMEFLSRIHSECPSLGATQEELENEQIELAANILDKPELTEEYLRSIGREDMITYGNGQGFDVEHLKSPEILKKYRDLEA